MSASQKCFIPYTTVVANLQCGDFDVRSVSDFSPEFIMPAVPNNQIITCNESHQGYVEQIINVLEAPSEF